MLKSKTIHFKEVRDFGQLINATFTFIRQNGRQLAKSLLYFAGPIILIAYIFMSLMVGHVFQAISANAAPGFSMIIYYLGLIIGFIVAYAMILTILHSFIKIYVEEGRENTSTERVWEVAKSYFGKIFGFQLLTGLIIFVGFMFFFIPGIYFMVSLSLIFIAGMHENLNFSDAFSRSIELVKNNWWQTFALMLVINFIIGLISQIFILPPYIAIFVLAFSGITEQAIMIVVLAFLLIYFFILIFLYAVPFIALSFQYFSLVEKTEGHDLMQRINEIDGT